MQSIDNLSHMKEHRITIILNNSLYPAGLLIKRKKDLVLLIHWVANLSMLYKQIVTCQMTRDVSVAGGKKTYTW